LRFAEFIVNFTESTGYFQKTKDPNLAKEIFNTKNVKELFQYVADAILKFLFNGNKHYQFNDENNVLKSFELITREGYQII
jgi:hypothetical protein